VNAELFLGKFTAAFKGYVGAGLRPARLISSHRKWLRAGLRPAPTFRSRTFLYFENQQGVLQPFKTAQRE